MVLPSLCQLISWRSPSACCDRVAIVSQGQVIAIGTIEELRAGRSAESLEDIFLELTGGAEEAEIAAALA